MTKTYAQLQQQIDTLTREADALKREERAGVVARILEAIAAYGLTAADLGLAPAGRVQPAANRRPATRKASRRKTTSGPSAARFRDAAGNAWGGRGPRPAWLRDALATGKTLADFAV